MTLLSTVNWTRRRNRQSRTQAYLGPWLRSVAFLVVMVLSCGACATRATGPGRFPLPDTVERGHLLQWKKALANADTSLDEERRLTAVSIVNRRLAGIEERLSVDTYPELLALAQLRLDLRRGRRAGATDRLSLETPALAMAPAPPPPPPARGRKWVPTEPKFFGADDDVEGGESAPAGDATLVEEFRLTEKEKAEADARAERSDDSRKKPKSRNGLTRMGANVVQDTSTKSRIRIAVAGRVRELTACIATQDRASDHLVEVSARVGPDGRLSDLKLSGDVQPRTQRCMSDALRSVRIEGDGDSHSVQFGLRLRAS